MIRWRFASIALLYGCAAVTLPRERGGWGVEPGALLYFCVAVPAFILFATEPERLPRVLEREVPTRRIRALLAAPFLPGGGRGALLATLSIAVLFGWMLVTRACLAPEAPLFGDVDTVQVSGLCLYALVYVLLPSVIAAPWSSSKSVRLCARAAPFALLAFGMLVVDAEHPRWGRPGRFAELTFASPEALLEDVTASGVIADRSRVHFAILAALASLAILLNLPRMVRGVREVLVASVAPSDDERSPRASSSTIEES